MKRKDMETCAHMRGNAPEASAYAFFRHTQCEYFPCHETARPEDFNCLFCYCPLYALGEACGGRFRYTKNRTKDCSDCLIPHERNACSYIARRFPEIKALAARKPNAE